MSRLTLILLGLVFGLLAAFLHYTLPQRDIVMVIGTNQQRMDFGANSLFWAQPDAGMANAGNRDVRFIEAMTPGEDIRVYRNEDTGWGWPPYFKLESSNLQARAKSLASTMDDPQWAVLTHYGWRLEVLSIYPNAVRIRAVDSPDIQLFPWLNITILAALAALVVLAVIGWLEFYEHRVEPVLDRLTMARDRVGDQRRIWGTRLRDWIDRLRGWIGLDGAPD